MVAVLIKTGGIIMVRSSIIDDNHIDDHVDDEIRQCLTAGINKSFFMFAGAGSGKTRSLIKALSFLDEKIGHELSLHAKQIAVITYTNAACDEISRRLQHKPIFFVSTIHSFIWDLIRNYQLDIKSWIISSLEEDICNLMQKQSKGGRGNTVVKKAEEIERKRERLNKIERVKRFSYNPNGDNIGHDSLNHSEVIKMGSQFIMEENIMQHLLINKYPILLIDESQDTKKELVDALFNLQNKYKNNFVVGMFGDTMQKIYMDGKNNLASCIPDDWEQPKKIMNHRSASRIVELANAIRRTVDAQQQQARSDAEIGAVRLFIASNSSATESIERRATEVMAQETGDNNWYDELSYKSLILEHHMAAKRFGFYGLYEPLNNSKLFDTSLRDGSISELYFLANVISPLVEAYKNDNAFEVSRIIRQHSLLLSKKTFITNSSDQIAAIHNAQISVDTLMSLWNYENIPNCLDVLKSIKDSGLFALNDRVEYILSKVTEHEDEKITALRQALSVPFNELEVYYKYVTDNSRFATHQGVKGLEFQRVLVIMSDDEAKGCLFNYEKLFGAKPKTDTDMKNEQGGKDSSIMRTTRLFYVACTRAQKSLAVLVYTDNIDDVKATALKNNWFKEEEIIII